MASSRVLWLAVPALVLLASRAHADPTPQQKELARDLMQKGHDARNAHDWKLALESFKGADDVMHVPTTAFEVARSQVDLALLVEAHETLLAVMRMPERPGEPQAFRDARGYARVLDDDLVPRIPQLRITLQGAAGSAPTVVVDGATLPEGALLVPYKVDPGHHVVGAKTDSAEVRAEVDVAERQTKDVTLTLTASAPAVAAVPAPTAAPPPEATPPTPETPTSGRAGLGAVAWTGFGVGAAGVALGSVTGIMTITQKSSIASQCNGTHCPPSTYDSLSSASTVATISTVSFIVAGAGVGVGIAAWLLGRDHGQPPPTTGLRVTPWVGIGSAGAAGTF